jgi:hypothetical protein
MSKAEGGLDTCLHPRTDRYTSCRPGLLNTAPQQECVRLVKHSAPTGCTLAYALCPKAAYTCACIPHPMQTAYAARLAAPPQQQRLRISQSSALCKAHYANNSLWVLLAEFLCHNVIQVPLAPQPPKASHNAARPTPPVVELQYCNSNLLLHASCIPHGP